MKFICPESQKRVSLKWGNIVSTLSSGGGSAGASTPFSAGAVLTVCAGLDCCDADRSGTCCPTAEKEPASAIAKHKVNCSLAVRCAVLKMNLNFIMVG